MRRTKSQGRRIPILLFFSLLVFSSIGGAWIAFRSVAVRENALEAARGESAKAELSFLSSAVNTELKNLREDALRGGGEAILHWAEIEADSSGRPSRVLRVSRGPGLARWAGSDEAAFEKSYLEGAFRNLDLNGLRRDRMGLLRVKPDSGSSAELLAVAFPKGNDAEIVLALVSPMTAFPVFSAARDTSVRYYWIAADGLVLAHSEPSYVGSHFGDSPVFSQGVLNVFRTGAKPSGLSVSPLASIDQLPVTAAFSRLGGFPFALVVESVAEPGFALKDGAEILFEVGALLTVLLALSIAISYGMAKLGRRGEAAEDAPATAPKAVDEASRSLSIAQEISGEEIVNAQGHASVVSSMLAAVDDFETEASALDDPKRVSERLAVVASRLYQAPALFFRYQPAMHVAILESTADLEATRKTLAMSFPVNDRAIAHISESVKVNSIASLARYPALSQVLSSRIGAKAFDAWAVTGPTEAGREPWILGFLVILKDRVGEQAHETMTLARLMRASGLVYGKAIVGQF